MSDLVTAERAKYEDMWTVEAYNVNSPGERLVPSFMDMAGAQPGDRVLDAGCGAGRGAIALAARGLVVTCCDITGSARVPEAREFGFVEQPLWEPIVLEPVDFVYCCDVLEHIPPQFTMLVVRRLMDVARRGVFLSISHIPDTYGAWIGQTLHETVQPFTWWRDNLAVLGELIEARDLLISGLFFVRPLQ